MRDRKKILIVAPYGFNGKMTNFIEFVTARLLAKHGWEVTAMARSENNSTATDRVNGIIVHRYVTTGGGLRKLLSLLLFSRPRLLHIHNLRNNRVGIAAAMLCKILRIPFFFTEYGLLHDHYLVDDREDPLGKPLHTERVLCRLPQLARAIAGAPKEFRYFIGSYLFHFPLTHADKIIFVSRHNVPIAEKLGLGNAVYLPQLSDTVRFENKGVDLNVVLNKHEEEVRERIAAESGINALFIGQMKLRKGWDIMLRAIPHISPTVIQKFIIVSGSSDTEEKEFETLVESLNIRDRIAYLGRIFNGALLRAAYEKSAFLVVPSRYEGFGLAPLEAFEIGKPVVASRVEALTDFLVDGENALLVTPKNPEALVAGISKLARDAVLQKTLVAGGKKTLAKMRSEEYAKRWLELYDNALDL